MDNNIWVGVVLKFRFLKCLFFQRLFANPSILTMHDKLWPVIGGDLIQNRTNALQILQNCPKIYSSWQNKLGEIGEQSGIANDTQSRTTYVNKRKKKNPSYLHNAHNAVLANNVLSCKRTSNQL